MRQICVNLQKYWNNLMSNDGFIIENMELSLIYLAVPRDSILNGLYSLLPLLLDLTADVTKRHTWHLLLISVALFTIAIKLLALKVS